MDDIPARKSDHIDITTQRAVTASVSPGWDDVHLIHQSLPEIDLDEVDLRTSFLGHKLAAPVVIASMTGGHPRAREINLLLARAAEEYGLAMGVGSQRAAIRHPELLETYAVARQTAPGICLISNIGAPQLIPQGGESNLTLDEVSELVSSMRADALAVHLNYLQEVVQPGGDTRARGCLEAIRAVAQHLTVPVIAKETGAGLSEDQGRALVNAGVAALDVGGAGGTSFALVEAERAADRNLDRYHRLGQVLGDWGLPTAVSVIQCSGLGVPVIATGGVRSGLDAAKALALGAGLVGIARPMMGAALEGYAALGGYLEELLDTLRIVLFLTGSRTPSDLQSRPRVVTGVTADWIEQLRRTGPPRPTGGATT